MEGEGVTSVGIGSGSGPVRAVRGRGYESICIVQGTMLSIT